MRFASIEGLRGYLAWAVVLSHLTYMAHGPALFRTCGSRAVVVFIAISGFVITHILLLNPEPYRVYILKRFMRLFPLFALFCVVGFFTDGLLASVPLQDPEFKAVVSAVAASDRAWLPAHLAAHVTMLHGLIPNKLLPHSEYAFDMPAWSISLEWQFYLLAPLIIAAIRQRLVLLVIATAVMAWVCRGTEQPGALPHAMPYLALGILARLANLPVPRHVLLEHPVAQYFGARSYAVYLCHYPVLSMLMWYQSLTMLPLTLIGIPCIVVTAELAYRWVEQPGIALGKKLTQKQELSRPEQGRLGRQ